MFESIQSNGDNNEQNDSFASVLSWMNSDSHFVSIKALEFLKEIYEVLCDMSSSFSTSTESLRNVAYFIVF